MIVRSSGISEDTEESSEAGKYESVAGVRGRDAFIHAVERVIHSFGGEEGRNQVLVQPMLHGVSKCGVAFTADPNSGGNYYVINYDESGSTDSVTSGMGEGVKLLYVFKDADVLGMLDEDMESLCRVLDSLEKLFACQNIDVEFAFAGGELYILQARVLVMKKKPCPLKEQRERLCTIAERIRHAQEAKPFLCGHKTIFGIMPDWNPAEMIGIHPKPLALSLYREIITDSIWAYQRDNYGYRNLRSFPLMADFFGMPYIDIRVSFNSFIPAGLDEGLGEKLVNYYLDRLAEEPSKHDKVEFEIVFSCYTLDILERIGVLRQYGFSSDEIGQILKALRDVTNGIINSRTGLWRKDYEKIRRLEKRYGEIMASGMGEIEKIYWLLEDCKRYGSLPFAGLARAAFVAVELLRSFVATGIIDREDYHDFMNDIVTVGSEMKRDFASLQKGEFLKRYGHVRPGTYDINSPRYDEQPDLYFDWDRKEGGRGIVQPDTFSMKIPQMERLESALRENGLDAGILEIMDFIRSVIVGREYGKFMFTRNLSRALQMVSTLGESHGLSREECSYVSIQTLRELYVSVQDVGAALKRAAESGRAAYEDACATVLPPLILRPDDVYYFYYPDSQPTFITQKRTIGAVFSFSDGGGGMGDGADIHGKILLIPSADPGYDWIFSHGIKGFVTMYGGANSHMAIRAGEMGVPAVIGCGRKQFERYAASSMLEIDPAAKTIRILR